MVDDMTAVTEVEVQTCLEDLPAISWATHGWIFMLPRLSGQRVLLLGKPEQETVELIRKLSGAAVVSVDVDAGETLDQVLDRCESGPYDAVVADLVHHSPMSLFRCRAELSRFIDRLARLTAADGYLYIALQNQARSKFLIGTLLNFRWLGLTLSWSGIGLTRIDKRLKSESFRDLRIHPLGLYETTVNEVLPLPGYRSYKNSHLPRERFKERLYGKTGIRWLAKGYALVADRREAASGFVDRLIGDLCQAQLLDAGRRSSYGLRRYMVFGGKTIISLGTASEADAGVVAVFPLDRKTADRRLRELEMTRFLRTLSAGVAKYIPVVHQPRVIEGCLYFPIREIPGISVELAFPDMGKATRNAAAFLLELNSVSRQRWKVDDAVYQRLFAEPFVRAREQAAALLPSLTDLELRVRSLVTGRSMDSVVFHGDFKLENMILDRHSLDLNGVIDWELASRQGLPLLDLFYLIVYNTMMREDVDHLRAIDAYLLPQNLASDEQALINEYRERMNIDDLLFDVLQAMFFVHHIGMRLTLDIKQVEALRRMDAILRKLQSGMAARYG